MNGLFNKFFGKKSVSKELSSSQIDTAPLRTNQIKGRKVDITGYDDQIVKYPKFDLPQLIVACGHSTGKQRDHNEDAIFTLTSSLIVEESIIPFGLYIVADGMGGHQNGEIASAVSIRSLATHAIQEIYLSFMGLSGEKSEQSVQEILKEGILQAHRTVMKDVQGGGTTLTAAMIMDDKMTITHVGDSRAYLIYTDGKREILTQDHSLVKRLEELGQITADEAAIHPQRNVLYRALGQGEPIEPDIATFSLPHACHLLICSDGLWGVITEGEMLRIVNTSHTPQHACQSLVDAANNAGGPDNISVILVRLPD
jgi:serine/threonine protein phosphatase PrpC